MQVSHRHLYFKDKDLDRKNYKPSEQEQLEAYLKNHLQDDPKALTEEQKAKLYEEFKQLQSQSNEPKAQTLEQTRKLNIQQSNNFSAEASTPPAIDPTMLKDMFDKMTEIDSDPDSKRAQDYYKRLEEIERKNPNKKKSQIIIKTMKRGRTVKQESFQDGSFIGKQITEEEKIFHRKYIDYKAVQFPEINPIELKVKGQGKELKIANFRFPSLQQERKGIIFFNNGYGDYCARYAFFAEQFAKAGYDFVCMDGRGFGHSDGKRAFIESEKSMSDDILKFQDLVVDKFGDKNTPKLMLGVSMGGLVSAKLSLMRPNFYNGMGLVVPYMKLLNQEVIDSKMGLVKMLDNFFPSFRVPIPLSQKKAILKTKHLQSINNDPLLEVEKIPIRNLVVNEASLRSFQQKESELVTTPFVMILSGRDQVVDNRGSKDFFEIQSTKVKDKDLITYEDADHFLLLDNEYVPLVTKDLIGWFNTHV